MQEVVLHYEEPAEADQTKMRAESEEEISVEEQVSPKGKSGGSDKDGGGSGGSKGMNPSITTSNENRKNSAANSDGMTGQPISSLQRAIRNTIIGGVKSSISRQSDSDHDQAGSD